MDRVPQDAVVGLALSLGHALQTRLTFEHFIMEIRIKLGTTYDKRGVSLPVPELLILRKPVLIQTFRHECRIVMVTNSDGRQYA